ncbi:DUF6602 domain-containing protein [Aliivibrio sifiae]|uniref:DUF6602 domain-containing protein n=1 Tax=Aliivibrio sifiae TaxID=566293 RepID=UPI003D0D71BD
MASKIFKSIIDSKFTSFYRAFSEDARSLFYDENEKKLIHAAEYGRYREELCADFLALFSPQYLKFSTGFVITSHDQVSTQCDIIVYDSELTPIIRDDDRNYFFPVENVQAIGEVKSTIASKKELGAILLKMSKNKELSASISDESTVVSGTYVADFPMNDVFTFLICKNFKFDTEDICEYLEEFYKQNNVKNRYKHNVIISLDDGVIIYKDKEGILSSYPVMEDMNLPSVFKQGEEQAINGFVNSFFVPLTFKQRLCVDLQSYMR